ncbi:MAG: diguanylate cyclase, partial [Candidatus Omnitrophica bacterium]|nr:diguanylate cyclase [Candidatus Omnitrophota bacterium]
IFIIAVIVFLGWWIVFEVFSSIIKIHTKFQKAPWQAKEKEALEAKGGENEAENLGEIFNLLTKKVGDLEIIDPLTGLYNEKVFLAKLEEEIKRATVYQRPCGLLAAEINNYKAYEEGTEAPFDCAQGKQNSKGTKVKRKIEYAHEEDKAVAQGEKFLKKTIEVLKDNVRDIDILGRIQDNKIGIILIERNKRQCLETVRKLKEALSIGFKDSGQLTPQISFAVAENPLDGKNAAQLLEAARAQLNQ